MGLGVDKKAVASDMPNLQSHLASGTAAHVSQASLSLLLKPPPPLYPSPKGCILVCFNIIKHEQGTSVSWPR